MKLSKRLFGFFFFLMILFTVNGQEKSPNTKDQPKVAVVFSGGGAKGFAHVGVLKVLEEEGFPIDIIVGTSIGSLIGGVYSMGYTASEIEEIVKSQNWEMVLSDNVPRLSQSKNDQAISQRYLFSLPLGNKESRGFPSGMIKGQNVLNLFCGLAGNIPYDTDFSNLPISFACVAADLETGNEVVMKKGFLPTAMYASMAIPGAFLPCEREGLILVDGGVVNNFPTDIARQMGADIIIGVDIRGGFQKRESLKTMNEVLGNLINLYSKSKDSINNSLCDLIIHPDISGYSSGSFSSQAADTLIVRGEKAANAFRDQIRELKQKYHLQPKAKSRELIMPEKWHIVDLNIVGDVHEMNELFFRKSLNLQFPGDYSYDEIKNAIDHLYGNGGFNKVYFSLSDSEKGKILNLHAITEKESSLNIGLKVNTTDAAALLLNVTKKNYGVTFGFLSASAELSANPGIDLIAETHKINLPTWGVELKGKYQNYNIYEDGSKIFNADLFYSSGSIYMYQSFLKRCNLGLGIQQEYYDGDIFLKNGNSLVSTDSSNHFVTNAYGFFSFDNMPLFYFPKKGTSIYAEFSINSTVEETRENSAMLLFKMKNVFSLTPKTALLLDFYNRSIFNADFPAVKTTFVGGDSYSQYFSYHLPFIGLPPVVMTDRFTSVGMIGLRYQLSQSHYISLLFNTLQQGSKMADWNSDNAAYGGGIKYSMKTIIGPIDIAVGYSDMNSETTFSANLGYWF